MIYEYPGTDAPIRQGNIFVGMPRVEVSMGPVPVLQDDETVAVRTGMKLP